MQKEKLINSKLNIELVPVSTVSFVFSGSSAMVERLLGSNDENVYDNWFETFDKESRKITKKIKANEELREQLDFLRTVAEYAHNSETANLYLVQFYDDRLYLQFYFTSYEDAESFEAGLVKYIESRN